MEGDSNTVQAPVPDGNHLDVVVVRAISQATGQEPTELPPLADSLDFDALARLVFSDDDVHVAFEHAGCSVTVDGDTVTVEPH